MKSQLAFGHALFATVRTNMRRYTRLSNGFSRKLENHAAATALNYFAYNFIKIHRTLRTSPAMADGVTDRLWSVPDLVALWVAYEHRDLSFLKRQMEHFAFTTVVCTSARALREVSTMLDMRLIATGTAALLRWTVGTAVLPRGPVGVVGWNIPLKRPQG